jgi:hypothetical protein
VVRLDMNDLSHAYGITWRWNAASQDMPYRVDDRQVVQLLNQIGDKANQFDKSLERLFDRTRIDDPRGREEVHQSVKDFRQATARLRDRVNSRQSNTLDVEEVLRRGVSIDGFMQRYQLSAEAEQNWLSLRGELDRLARAYNVAWNWSNLGYTASEPGAGFHHRLTGTYQLENTRGDDPEARGRIGRRFGDRWPAQLSEPPDPVAGAGPDVDRAQWEQRNDGLDTRPARDRGR